MFFSEGTPHGHHGIQVFAPVALVVSGQEGRGCQGESSKSLSQPKIVLSESQAYIPIATTKLCLSSLVIYSPHLEGP